MAIHAMPAPSPTTTEPKWLAESFPRRPSVRLDAPYRTLLLPRFFPGQVQDELWRGTEGRVTARSD